MKSSSRKSSMGHVHVSCVDDKLHAILGVHRLGRDHKGKHTVSKQVHNEMFINDSITCRLRPCLPTSICSIVILVARPKSCIQVRISLSEHVLLQDIAGELETALTSGSVDPVPSCVSVQ